jgi:fructosamine-3-kinase
VEITSPLRIRTIGGGSINATFHITTSCRQQWFCKINDARRFPDLFVLERQGLALLEATAMIRVPQTIACENIDHDQVLVLEWINEGLRTDAFWQNFGEQLAWLHRQTNKTFGLDYDNYMGALPQSNTPSPDWVDFFIHQRLEPQVSLAAGKGLLSQRHLEQFHQLYRALPAALSVPSMKHMLIIIRYLPTTGNNGMFVTCIRC